MLKSKIGKFAIALLGTLLIGFSVVAVLSALFLYHVPFLTVAGAVIVILSVVALLVGLLMGA